MRLENSLAKPALRPSNPSALSILLSESRRTTSRGPGPQSEGENENERVREGERRQQQQRGRERERLHTISSESDVNIPTSSGYNSAAFLPATESTPLVSKKHTSRFMSSIRLSSKSQRIHLSTLISYQTILHAIPAVFLGLLINILDGVSYGMIVFPTTGIFSGFGGTGVSMFFVTYRLLSFSLFSNVHIISI